jgi:integrase
MTKTITNTDPVTIANPGISKGGGIGPVTLTDRMCEKRVDRRVKFYDRKCPGLYVSINVDGVATFSFRYTDRFTGKRKSVWLGVHIRGHFTVDDARAQAHALKGRIGMGENVVETLRQQGALKAKQGMTVDELIEKRIEWMSGLEKKKDGEKRPRIESWANVASHLRRFVSPNLGRKIAAEVTRSDVAELSNDILDGKFGAASVSNARHMRRAVSGMYNWAMEAGRDYVPVTCQPCLKLPKLPKEHARKRVLSEAEIRIFWHGLDRSDLPWGRRTRLALKFELVTMLRSGELLGARRDELFDLDGEHARFDVPLKRVKKRRTIQQPLSELAVEILREALEDGKEHVFASPLGDQSLERKAMSGALRGTKHKNGKTKTPGICELLGLTPFTAHDLRRTAATWARRIGKPLAKIALCLDHRVTHDDEGIPLPPVTSIHYVHAEDRELMEKREVLDAWAATLRRMVGEPDVKPAAGELQIAA